MEVEIFCVFFIFGSMSTMVSKRIFDKRANYGGRIVIISEYSEFSRWKMYFCINLYSKSLLWSLKYFGHVLFFGTISTMVPRRIFGKCANYVERFVARWGYSKFSRWKKYLCTNLSQNLLRWRVKYFWHFLSLEQCLQCCRGGFLINVTIM